MSSLLSLHRPTARETPRRYGRQLTVGLALCSALIALTVYLLGGIAYQRAVMHQRGWRQLPNYGAWAAAAAFVRDAFLAVFASCARPFTRRRRGGGTYAQLPAQGEGYNGYAGRGQAPTRDDENRLIDQLDEEWDE